MYSWWGACTGLRVDFVISGSARRKLVSYSNRLHLVTISLNFLMSRVSIGERTLLPIFM